MEVLEPCVIHQSFKHLFLLHLLNSHICFDYFDVYTMKGNQSMKKVILLYKALNINNLYLQFLFNYFCYDLFTKSFQFPM